MKLLFVLKGSALNRGMNTGIENLAWQLAENGAEVHILSGGSQPARHSYCLPSSVSYYFTNGNGAPGDHINLYTQIRREQHFDAVIGWIRNIGPLAALEPINSNRPRFIANEGQITNSNFFRRLRLNLKNFRTALNKRNLPLKAALRIIMNNDGAYMDSLVAISQAVKENIEKVYGIPGERVLVMPRGVDTDFFHPSNDNDRSILSDPPRLLFSGNITKSKGLGDVAEALAMVKQPIEWVLCGNDKGYLQQLQDTIESIDTNHRLTWAGSLNPEALRTQIQCSDIFVFCSWSEGLGKSLLEAMSCSLPVIVSNINAFRDVVVDHENGLVVTVSDPYRIAEAINAYLNDPELRTRCGLNARKTIKQAFNKHTEAAAWDNLLNKLIKKS